MIYKNSNEVLEAMKTATDYDRETKLKHLYAVLLKHEQKLINIRKLIEEKNKPKKK